MWPSVKQIAQDVKSGKKTARQYVEESLEKIATGSELNAIITVAKDEALARAGQIDAAVKAGDPVGELAGVPFIAKDNYLTKGVETTAASNILKGFTPPYSATVIKKLEEAGAVMVAKANLDSFAHGSSTENSDFGTTLNPHDKSRVPGGSSGGSGAAVAAGMAPFALGTDTGGSIRLPASFCGVVGYKPTYGLVSRYGVVAMASSTDVMGPIANSVEDAEAVLNVIAGQDEYDSTTIKTDLKPSKNYEDKKLKIGLIEEFSDQGLDPEVKTALDDTVKRLQDKGHSVETVQLPDLDYALAVYYIIMPAEVSSNLSRYDGVRYGFGSSGAETLEDTYEMSREEGFNDEVKRRVMLGTYVLSSGYYDAYYRKAQIVRTKLINSVRDKFKEFDILLSPTSPTPAFKIGEKSNDPLKMYLADIMTVTANLVGVPAVSIPGKTEKLPVGIQLMADFNQDGLLLYAAKEATL